MEESGIGTALVAARCLLHMQENAMPTAKKEQPALEDDEPAKGGIERPKSKPYPSGDSPKPHGDPLKDELQSEKKP